MHITSMKTRLLVLFLPLFFFSFAILSGVSYYLSRQALGKSVDETAYAVGLDYSFRVKAYLDEGIIQLGSFNAIKRIYDPADRGQLLVALKECQQRLGNLDNITYIAPDGAALRPDGSTLFLGDREYFKQAIATKKNVVSDIILNKTTGKIGVNVASPVMNNGQVTGVLTGAISLQKLAKLINGMQFLDTGYGVIAASSGNVVVHPKRPEVDGKMSFLNKTLNPELKFKESELDDRLIALFKQAVDSGKQVRGTYRFADGVVRVGSFTPIQLTENQRWIMIVTAPEAEAFAHVTTLSYAMLLTSILCFIVAILCILLISRRIAGPISLVRDECKLLAQGDLRGQSSQISSRDEIGQLAGDFQIMRKNLQNLVRKVLAQSEQLAASSEELTSSAQQSAHAAHQVAASVGEIASGAEKQATASDRANASALEIAVKAKDISRTADGVTQIAVHASQTAGDGLNKVEQAVAQMNEIGKGSLVLESAIGELSRGSAKIGEIVALISAIAKQTNLLALNAAIEAARAGEQGRGFAVVADEVRKLAEESNHAAQQIGAVIKQNQSDMEKAVAASRSGSAGIQAGISMVNDTGETFKEIVNSIVRLSGEIQGISAAISQLSGGNQTLVENIREIDSISRNTAAESQNVSAATQEQSASMQQIASASQNLAELAGELQAAVEKFLV